jgi:hypothetical protein
VLTSHSLRRHLLSVKASDWDAITSGTAIGGRTATVVPEKAAGYQTPRFHRDDWLGYRTASGGAFARHRCELFRDGDAGLGSINPTSVRPKATAPNLLIDVLLDVWGSKRGVEPVRG